MSLFLSLSVLAQETQPTLVPDLVATVTPPAPVQVAAAADSALYYLVVVVLALLLTAAVVFGGYITKYLAALVPAETAASIYQSGVRLGIEVALNQAAKTSSPLDDEFFESMARQRGLVVTKQADGSYSVSLPTPAGLAAPV